MQRWSGRAVRVFLVETAVHISILGEITRLEGDRLTIRCIPPRGFERSGRCALAIEEDGRLFRAQGHLEAVGDITLTVRLLAPPSPVERRMYGRAEIVARLRVQRAEGASLPWALEDMELSPSGLKFLGPLPLKIGERVGLELHIPGPGGGRVFELKAEVARRADADEAPFTAFQFVDLKGTEMLNLVDVVDQSLLGLSLGACWGLTTEEG